MEHAAEVGTALTKRKTGDASAPFRNNTQQERAVGGIGAYGAAFLISFLSAALLFPFSFIVGNGGWFENGDVAQHISGWLAYSKDSWHWPLLHTNLLNYPTGMPIVFTDSIPIAALFFKIIGAVLPNNFQYFGLWLAGSYVFQGIGGAFLVRSLGSRTYLASMAGALLAICWPVFLHRMGHIALATHPLLLFSLGLYFRVTRQDARSIKAVVALMTVTVIALLVHPYLFAMSYPLFIIALSQNLRLKLYSLKTVVILIAISLLTVAMILVAGGYLTQRSTMSGFGHYSTNLLSPFCGGGFCAVPDATGGQSFEGFNYLGIGSLSLVAVTAIVLTLRRQWGILFSHPLLLALLVGYTVYALSSIAFVGKSQIYSINIHGGPFESLTDTFRASGRFFWLVGYGIAFSSLAYLFSVRSRILTVAILLALIIQFVEVLPKFKEIRRHASMPASGSIDRLADALGESKAVDLFPTYGCGPEAHRYQPYQLAAATRGIPINTAYTARADTNCALSRIGLSGTPIEGHAYILFDANEENVKKAPSSFRASADQFPCFMSGPDRVCGSQLKLVQKQTSSNQVVLKYGRNNAQFAPGQQQVYTVMLMNDSSSTVSSEFKVRANWYELPNFRAIETQDSETVLQSPLEPTEQREVSVKVIAPSAKGRYLVKIVGTEPSGMHATELLYNVDVQ